MGLIGIKNTDQNTTRTRVPASLLAGSLPNCQQDPNALQPTSMLNGFHVSGNKP